jgi:CRP-like cAMP-binding protein
MQARSSLDCFPVGNIAPALVYYAMGTAFDRATVGRHPGVRAHGRAGQRGEGEMPARYTESLRQSPLFADLSDESLQPLAEKVRPRRFEPGEVVFEEGAEANALYVIAAGEVKITVAAPTAQRIVLAILGPGEAFGELALLDGSRRSATAEATEPTEMLVVRRADFMAVIEAHPAVSRAVLSSLAGVIRRTNEQVADIAMRDVHGRIAKVLLRLAERYGRSVPEGILIDRPVSTNDLAALVGLYPVEVERHLRAYAYDDLLRTQGDRLLLRHVERFERAVARPRDRVTLDLA